MEKNTRITVKEAAEMLGMSQQGVKEHMKRNLFTPPIGHVTRLSESRRQYHIYKNMVEQYLSGTAAAEEKERPKSQEELIGEAVLQMIRQIVGATVGP